MTCHYVKCKARMCMACVNLSSEPWTQQSPPRPHCCLHGLRGPMHVYCVVCTGDERLVCTLIPFHRWCGGEWNCTLSNEHTLRRQVAAAILAARRQCYKKTQKTEDRGHIPVSRARRGGVPGPGYRRTLVLAPGKGGTGHWASVGDLESSETLHLWWQLVLQTINRWSCTIMGPTRTFSLVVSAYLRFSP